MRLLGFLGLAALVPINLFVLTVSLREQNWKGVFLMLFMAALLTFFAVTLWRGSKLERGSTHGRLADGWAGASVTALICGPLIGTPQGWIVVVSIIVYAALALAFGVFGLVPPLGKSIESAVMICVFWPGITFMFFIQEGLPSSFVSSWRRAIFLTIGATAPILYVIWRVYVSPLFHFEI